MVIRDISKLTRAKSVAPILVFDLDGTLVESIRDLVPALNAATATVGLPEMAEDDVAHIISHGAKAMIKHAFEFHHRSVDEPEIEKLFGAFLEYYENHIADNTCFYPGAIATMNRFRQQNWKLAICTNKSEQMAKKLIATLQQGHLFDAICGHDTFETKKPNPGHLFKTIELAEGDPKRAIMIGDSGTDIATAKAATIPVIAVDFGYPEAPIDTLDPDIIISHFDELDEAVANLMKV